LVHQKVGGGVGAVFFQPIYNSNPPFVIHQRARAGAVPSLELPATRPDDFRTIEINGIRLTAPSAPIPSPQRGVGR